MRILACALLALATGCAGHRASDRVIVRIAGSAERPLSPERIRYAPADNVISARLGTQGTLVIERRNTSRALAVEIPEMCPVTVPAGAQRQPADAKPVIDLGPDRPPVGFDAPFAITVRHGCDSRGRGRIRWQQIEGAPVSDLLIGRDGFELRARTPRFETLHPQAPAQGIVAFSPRTQGRVVFEALWRAPNAPPIRRTIAIVATSRATGLSSVSVSQQLLLAGTGWRVQQAPQFGHARVHEAGDALSEFTPDAQGRWQLEHDGRTLVVQATWHDKTPYDCGRSECHAGIAQTTQESAMSASLARQLDAPQPSAVGCMLDCHVLGERGLRDGGFLNVSAQLGFSWLTSTRWQDLPQALRRLGGVRCTACHGPGALPEPEGRELVLRSDVCATCHDAPPRYTHVEQWRASRMARSDAAADTRSGKCATCHTTAGFLEHVADRRPRAPSLDAEPTGIACAACHAPHAEHRGARLLRSMPGASEAIDPRSAACMQCHSPAADETQPSASSGVLWSGRVRVPAQAGSGWETLEAAGAHASVRGGCIGCHGATEVGRLDHSFRADAVACKPCHAGGVSPNAPADSQALQERARVLAQTLERTCTVTAPANARPEHVAPGRVVCRAPGVARALYEVSVVREDPAAFVHNSALARRLLDDAEQLTIKAGQNGRARTPSP